MNKVDPLPLSGDTALPTPSSVGEGPPRQKGALPGPGDWMLSTLSTLVLAFVLWRVLSWAVVHGVFGTTPQSCSDATGACWSVIRARWRIILFGLYPMEEQWRSAIASVIAVCTLALACMPRMWSAARMVPVWLGGYLLFLLFIHGGVFGLDVVTSSRWGGLTLTLFIYITVIAFGLPIAIGLALLRQSRYPVFRYLTAFIVDVTRSLPLLTILFSATVIIPLMLPHVLQGDKLVRSLVGFTFFFACYQSEIVRGGLQAVGRGQVEASQALGMSYWHTTSLITLPQAFRIAMPATINQFVITFKETSLVIIVGLFDLMASAQAAYHSGEWSAYHTEVYVFVALIYFIGSFSLSKYGKYVEKRFQTLR